MNRARSLAKKKASILFYFSRSETRNRSEISDREKINNSQLNNLYHMTIAID